MRFNFLLFFLFFTCFSSFGQLSEEIRTGRPGKSFGPFTVGKNILQLQGGFTYFEQEAGNNNSSGTTENLVVRFGITERIELSAVASHTSDRINEDYLRKGFNQLDAGFRINLFQSPSGFSGGWQTRVKFNVVDKDYKADNTGLVSAFSMSYPALEGGFTANGGVLFDGNDDGARFFYTLNYSRRTGQKWQIFLEPYGNYFNEWNMYVNAGAGYFVNNDLKLDFSAGIDLEDGFDQWFVDGGISYRFLGLR